MPGSGKPGGGSVLAGERAATVLRWWLVDTRRRTAGDQHGPAGEQDHFGDGAGIDNRNATLNMNWMRDFFGVIENTTKAAKMEVIVADEDKHGIMVSLMATWRRTTCNCAATRSRWRWRASGGSAPGLFAIDQIQADRRPGNRLRCESLGTHLTTRRRRFRRCKPRSKCCRIVWRCLPEPSLTH